MFCSDCGSPNRETARFCQSCGTAIEVSQQTQAVANVESKVSNEKVRIQDGSFLSPMWLIPLTAVSIAIGVSLALIFN